MQSTNKKGISNTKTETKKKRSRSRVTKVVKKTRGSGKTGRTNKGNRNYRKGYSLERYAVLTLEFNGWHVKRNFRSWGVEDVIATKKDSYPIYVQAKNYDGGLDEEEQYLFRFHAEDHGAIPIYLYVPSRGKRVWLNLSRNMEVSFEPFTKEWVKERSRIKKILSDLKNPKKSGSRKKWKKYVFENWNECKHFIC